MLKIDRPGPELEREVYEYILTRKRGKIGRASVEVSARNRKRWAKLGEGALSYFDAECCAKENPGILREQV